MPRSIEGRIGTVRCPDGTSHEVIYLGPGEVVRGSLIFSAEEIEREAESQRKSAPASTLGIGSHDQRVQKIATEKGETQPPYMKLAV